MERIKYYSSNDLFKERYLSKCEELLKQFDKEKEYDDINDILELYNLILYFDNNSKLLEWSEEEYKSYKDIVKTIKPIIYKYYNSLNNGNIKDNYGKVSISYRDDFWSLFNDNVDKLNIDDDIFNNLINSNNVSLIDILHYKKIVSKYDEIIKNHLLQNADVGTYVLIHRFIINDSKSNKLYIPNSLTTDNLIEIIKKYIQLDVVNLNYLNLLLNVSHKTIPLNLITRKKIKDKIKTTTESLHKTGISHNVHFSLRFVPNLDEPMKYEMLENGINLQYDQNLVVDNLEYPTILNNFIYLFNYVDKQNRWNCVSKKDYIDMFESLCTVRSPNDYLNSFAFDCLNHLDNLKQDLYYSLLSNLGIRLERVI